MGDYDCFLLMEKKKVGVETWCEGLCVCSRCGEQKLLLIPNTRDYYVSPRTFRDSLSDDRREEHERQGVAERKEKSSLDDVYYI